VHLAAQAGNRGVRAEQRLRGDDPRSAFAPAGLPVGAVTAAIGAPVFAWLLLKSS